MGTYFYGKEGHALAYSEKECLQRNLILRYFNRYLRDQGAITEREYLRLSHMIDSKYPPPKRTTGRTS